MDVTIYASRSLMSIYWMNSALCWGRIVHWSMLEQVMLHAFYRSSTKQFVECHISLSHIILSRSDVISSWDHLWSVLEAWQHAKSLSGYTTPAAEKPEKATAKTAKITPEKAAPVTDVEDLDWEDPWQLGRMCDICLNPSAVLAAVGRCTLHNVSWQVHGLCDPYSLVSMHIPLCWPSAETLDVLKQYMV